MEFVYEPALLEYMKANNKSYLTFLINFIVWLKSLSVSPGKPTIKSVDKAMFGIACLTLRINDL